ncbi:hypothetical protein GCM10011579_021300 [Streptomyces albiflavescens]|uniref:Uncharacterized protein n=1 Tax=Streptomyces albiflavescens TaxID=1623582 RepID=A0A917XZ99_9ACTN|nr:hypothetical protein GCM10011579_021300 [Streptomyces albiflavescens]
MLLFAAPLPAAADTEPSAPVTVPSLANWSAEQGSYIFDRGSRIVARDSSSSPRGDRLPGGRTAAVPQYMERGVGVCACDRDSFAVHRSSGLRWERDESLAMVVTLAHGPAGQVIHSQLECEPECPPCPIANGVLQAGGEANPVVAARSVAVSGPVESDDACPGR